MAAICDGAMLVPCGDIASTDIAALRFAGNGRRGAMGKRIAVIGVGAVGGYTAAHMVQAGEDVTFIDPWPEHVAAMQRDGCASRTIKGRAVLGQGARAAPDRGAAPRQGDRRSTSPSSVKSYDTQWAALMIRQYLAPAGYVVSLQNCMNEATIAEIVGWGKTLGCIASNISVGLSSPAISIAAASAARTGAHTVYRTGEVHGRVTERAEEVCRLVSHADSAKATDNLWGERWSKLVTNSMANGVSAATGLPGAAMAQNDAVRRFQARLGSEGDPHRPGTRLQAGGDQPPAAGSHRARRRGRRGGTGRNTRIAC
jgi:2-dehydropantoate 2-reductase